MFLQKQKICSNCLGLLLLIYWLEFLSLKTNDADKIHIILSRWRINVIRRRLSILEKQTSTSRRNLCSLWTITAGKTRKRLMEDVFYGNTLFFCYKYFKVNDLQSPLYSTFIVYYCHLQLFQSGLFNKQILFTILNFCSIHGFVKLRKNHIVMSITVQEHLPNLALRRMRSCSCFLLQEIIVLSCRGYNRTFRPERLSQNRK